MATPLTLSLLDTSLEQTKLLFFIPDINAANFETNLGVAGGANAIRTAVEAITLLNEVKLSAQIVVHTATAVSPNNAGAQREYGVKLYYVDTVTNRRGHVFIPGIDGTMLPTSGDLVNLAEAHWAALVTAMEENAVSRDGNPITVLKGVVTGRKA